MVSMRSRRQSVDHSIPAAKAAQAVGGAKTIGLIGGVALLLNNITGSAMVLFPALYQAAGWLLVTLALLAVAGLSYVCAIMIIEAMAAMPGNSRFDKRVEFTSLALFYLGRSGYAVTQVFFQMSLACGNISSIIQSVQVMDFAIAEIFGRSCATPEIYPNFRFWCPDPVVGDITVFGSIYVLSIGFIITALICAPLGFWNLDDNIIIQKVSCSLVLLMVMAWVGIFLKSGVDADRVPVIGTQFQSILGVVIFNFAVITSIPSWVNEKKENVSIQATMALAIPTALVLFTVIGIFGGMAYEPYFNDPSDETLLNKLRDSASALAKASFYLFPVVVNLTSIPVFAIMQRYNLLEAEVCGPRMANFVGVVLPWLICIPFYSGSGFVRVINWGGIIFNSTVNFIIPPLIYIAMVRRQQKQAAKHLITDVSLLMHPELSAEEIIEDFSTGHSLAAASIATMHAPGLLGNEHHRPRSASAMRKDFQMRVSRPGSSLARSVSTEPGAQLGPRSASVRPASSLAESLLPAELADSAALYDDNVTDADEATTKRVLGYDVFEAAREQDRLREEALREAAEELKRHHGRVTLTVPSIGDPSMHVKYEADMSRSHSRVGAASAAVAAGSAAGGAINSHAGTGASVAVISLSPRSHYSSPDGDDMEHLPPALRGGRALSSSAAGDMSQVGASLQSARDGSFMVLSNLGAEPWAAMPTWLLPHRIRLAKVVVTTLTLCVLIVIALNIQQCAQYGQCN